MWQSPPPTIHRRPFFRDKAAANPHDKNHLKQVAPGETVFLSVVHGQPGFDRGSGVGSPQFCPPCLVAGKRPAAEQGGGGASNSRGVSLDRHLQRTSPFRRGAFCLLRSEER